MTQVCSPVKLLGVWRRYTGIYPALDQNLRSLLQQRRKDELEFHQPYPSTCILLTDSPKLTCGEVLSIRMTHQANEAAQPSSHSASTVAEASS